MVSKLKNYKGTVPLIFLVLSLSIFIFFESMPYKIFMIDSAFHTLRIEGLYQSIANFDFYPDLNFTMINGYGYASPIFYGNLFLYPFALLRFFGINLITILDLIKATIFFTGLLSAYYSYYSFYKNKKNSFIFSISYMFSNMLLFTVFFRFPLGEIIGYILFLPLFFTFLDILVNKKNNYIKLGIILTLILCSHIISAVIYSLFLFTYLIGYCLITKSLCKEQILTYIKASIVFLFSSVWFIIPIILFKLTNKINLGNNSVINLSDANSGRLPILGFLKVKELFLYSLINNPIISLNLGIIFCISLIIPIFVLKNSTKLFKLNYSLLICYSIFIIGILPSGMLDSTIFNIFQFNYRFFIILILLSNILFFEYIQKLSYKYINYVKISYMLIIIFSSFIFLFFSYNINNYNFKRDDIYTIKGINNPSNYQYNIGSGKEYMPTYFIPVYSTDENIYILKKSPDTFLDSNKNVKNYKNSYNNISFTVETKNELKITVPRIYYTYYKVYLNNKDITNISEDKGLLSITIPKNSVGKITVKYKKPWTSYLSYLISFLFFIYLIIKKRLTRS